jgi:hypothetical protein
MNRLIVPMTLAALCLPTPSMSPSPAEARQVESVTGHAEFTAAGFRFRYSVSAIRHKDGRVTGEFQNHVENATTGEFILRAHVQIVCFTITGNIARIGGIIERQEGGVSMPGEEGFITVVDNGEGANDVPDLASPPAVGPDTAFTHCATGLPRPLLHVEHGNIQVRPSGL